MDPLSLVLGGATTLLGGLFGGNDKPEWRDVHLNTNLGMSEGQRDYGQQRAFGEYGNVRERIYGQGRTLLNEAMQNEMKNLRMAAGDMTPTMATFRGYASSQGVPTGISNVIAQQQAKNAQLKSQDWLGSQSRDIGSRYSRDLSNLLIQAQQAATPFFGMGMSATSQSMGEQNQNILANKQFAASTYNQQQIVNAQGRYGASVEGSRTQNPWVTTGMGLLGGALGQMGQSSYNPYAGASSTGGYGTPGDMDWGGSSFTGRIPNDHLSEAARRSVADFVRMYPYGMP